MTDSTSTWIRVCASKDLLPGEFQLAYDGDTAIAVFNIDGTLYAIEDVCTHDGGELAGGPVEGFLVECLRHGEGRSHQQLPPRVHGSHGIAPHCNQRLVTEHAQLTGRGFVGNDAIHLPVDQVIGAERTRRRSSS